VSAPNNLYASALDTLTISGRITDPDTSTTMGFVDVPRVHDGRIWTDKSVTQGGEADDFTVTLSALSQSFSITEGYAIPADTVFVIDVSGSMAGIDPGAGAPRISLLVDALNEAMSILQDANPLNRIAVVGYGGRSGGYARVEQFLPLGRYSAPTDDNAFFSFLPSPPIANQYLRINVGPDPRNIYVQGSTPTQWGIYYGSRILEQADTTVIVDVTDDTGAVVDQVTVTRRPNIILMTDGEPTMAWTNYAFDPTPGNPVVPGPSGNQIISPTAPGVFIGDGNYGEMGVSLLTVLTAAHRTQQVFQNYFSGLMPGDAPAGVAGQPGASVGFYTIGLGVQPTVATTNLIRATMDSFNMGTGVMTNYADAVHSDIRAGMDLSSPYTNNPYANPSDPTMGDLLRSFAAAPGTSIAFNAQRRQAFGTYVWDTAQVNVANTVDLTLANLAFTTDYFEAADLDGLRNAFLTITTSIQQQSTQGVTNVGDSDPTLSGWLVFSDVLGEYMEFRGDVALQFPGFVGGNAPVTGIPIDLNNSAVRDAFEAILLAHMNYGTPGAVTPAQVADLIQASMAAGYYNSVRYFADFGRNFVANYSSVAPSNAAALIEIFPMTGTISSPALGDAENLMLVAFHVITALQDGIFAEIFTYSGIAQVPTNRTLSVGDQLIRWYIPASLIPMRIIDVDSDGNFVNTPPVTGNIDPIRVSYTVGLNQERVFAEVTAAYMSANAAPDGSIYFYSNRWRNSENVTLAFFQPHPLNPFYQPGRPGIAGNTVLKQVNNTETARHVSLDRSFMYGTPVASRVALYWLGNNGRLTVPPPTTPPEPPGRIMVTKAFTFDATTVQVPPNNLPFTTPIVFTIINSDGDGVATLNFPDDFSWVEAQNRWALTLPVELSPGTYTVTKSGGVVDGYLYLPQPGVGIVTLVSGGLVSVDFVNEYFSRTPPEYLPALQAIKRFHGLSSGVFPPGFELVIQGPVGATPPNESGAWQQLASGAWEIRLNAAQAISGIELRSLALGVYRITEVNYRVVNGFSFNRTAWAVMSAHDSLMGDGTQNDLPILIEINSVDMDILVRVDNYYEPIAPPPPPEPPDTSEPPDPPMPPPEHPEPPDRPEPPDDPEEPGAPDDPDDPDDPTPPEYPEEPEEPTPPPTPTEPPIAPATGDYRQMTLYIVLLIAGILGMGGAMLYWLTKKYAYQGKHL